MNTFNFVRPLTLMEINFWENISFVWFELFYQYWKYFSWKETFSKPPKDTIF